MFLWLLHQLATIPGWSDALAAWEKITPRAAAAAGLSFAVAVLMGPRWIAWLRRRFCETIKSDSAEVARLHRDKQATPTMGGLFIMAHFPKGYDTLPFVHEALKRKVITVPGSAFTPDPDLPNNTLRLNFSMPSLDQIKTGILTLGDLSREML